MTKLFHDLCDHTIAVRRHRLHRDPQFVREVGRNTNGVPVKFRVPIMQALSFRFREIRIRRQLTQSFDQKLVPFHLAEFDLGIEARRVLVPRVGERDGIVPASGLSIRDENRVPQVLTSGKSSLQFSHPLSLRRVWPPVMADADDAVSRCRSVAWLYSPDLGNFPAESPPFLRAHSATFFAPGKSLLSEVDDDHRS